MVELDDDDVYDVVVIMVHIDDTRCLIDDTRCLITNDHHV